MIKILVYGPKGKMGKAIVKKAEEHPNIKIVCAIAPKGRDYVGIDLGLVAGLGKSLNCIVSDQDELLLSQCNMVVECTHKKASLEILKKCIEFKKPLVSGTTGFYLQDKNEFEKAKEKKHHDLYIFFLQRKDFTKPLNFREISKKFFKI